MAGDPDELNAIANQWAEQLNDLADDFGAEEALNVLHALGTWLQTNWPEELTGVAWGTGRAPVLELSPAEITLEFPKTTEGSEPHG